MYTMIYLSFNADIMYAYLLLLRQVISLYFQFSLNRTVFHMTILTYRDKLVKYAL